MTSRKLASSLYDIRIPQAIRSSLLSTPTSQPFLAKPPSFLATNVINSYFDKGQTKEAQKVFDEMPNRDVVTWTAMISGYTLCNSPRAAWGVFCKMRRDPEDVVPNEYTFSSTLKACKGMKSRLCGSLVHGLVIKHMMQGSIFVENVLLDVYATCSDTMDEACLLFEEISVKNDVSWTTLIAGYTHKNDGYGALHAFRLMRLEEAGLNPFCISIIVRACGSVGSSGYGKQIHGAVVKNGLESNIPVMNSLLDMYCKCGSLLEAEECFHGMIEKDSITWNTLIAGYEKTDSRKSLAMYSLMESRGFSPTCFTFTSILSAVANLAVLNLGEQIHGSIIRRGLEGNLELDNALIDMYAKCGSIASSRKAFDKMPCKSLVSWTSMIIGYGSHGYGNEAVEIFEAMVRSGTRPDQIVFMAVLSACSHAGLVKRGLRYFKSMIDEYMMKPEQEVYGCVVDLLGRAGKVEEAYELICSMPFQADETVWAVFLGACKMHKRPDLGQLAVTRLLELKPSIAGTYVTMSNLYADDGQWGEFAAARKVMRKMGSKKETGRSWVELHNQICCFVSGDKIGSHIECVYDVLDVLVKHMKDAVSVSDFDEEDFICKKQTHHFKKC